MSGDLLFPFPEPDFLFVHTVYLFSPDQMSKSTDERGKTVWRLPARVGGVPPVTPVMGYLTAPNMSKDTTGYLERQRIDAVLLLSNSTDIDAQYKVYCEDPMLSPDLKGTYEIDVVRSTISHRRVLLRRYLMQFESESEAY